MQCVGVDIAKKKFDARWLQSLEPLRTRHKSFANQGAGFEHFDGWLARTVGEEPAEIHVVMEATSVYHEALARYLFERGYRVSVVNPYRVKRFAESIGVKTKNDRHDPLVLARYGAQIGPRLWQPEPDNIKQLKALLSRLAAVEKDLRRERNRLEKARISRAPRIVIDSMETMIHSLTHQQGALEQAIHDHIDQDPDLKRDEKLLRTIPGIGEKLSQLLLAVIHSRPFTRATQVSAYLGVVPREETSGESVRGRPRLAKNGPGWIRAKLYFPAIVAKQHNPDVAALYNRLRSRGHCKKAALGGAMRKLVQIAYGVVKNQTPYQPKIA